MNKNKEIIEAIKYIGQEKSIPEADVVIAFEESIKKAYAKEYPEEEVEVMVDMNVGSITINKLFKVVEPSEELNEYCEISFDDAKKINSNIEIGGFIKESIDLWSLDERRVVTHILQVFKHLISVETNKMLYEEWAPKVGTVINAEIEKPDSKMGSWIVNLITTYGLLGRSDTIPDERLIPGKKYNFYVKEVKQQTKDWPVILSRADANLVKFLLTSSIPEIQEGMIEITNIARIAGFKTKVIVKSKQTGIDPIGSCIGPRGSRIKPIIAEIQNEKIEFIEWDENFAKLIANACTPANLYGFSIIEPTNEEEQRRIILVANDEQLALLIGLRGKNVRLLSMLFNANVDIKSVLEAKEEKIEFEKIDFNKYRQSQFARAYDKNINQTNDLYNVGLNSLPNQKRQNNFIKSSQNNVQINPTVKNTTSQVEIKHDSFTSFSKLSNEDVLAQLDRGENLNDDEIVVVTEDVNDEGLSSSIEEMENLIKDVQSK